MLGAAWGSQIFPLVTTDMLNLPKLCTKYMDVVSGLVTGYPLNVRLRPLRHAWMRPFTTLHPPARYAWWTVCMAFPAFVCL